MNPQNSRTSRSSSVSKAPGVSSGTGSQNMNFPGNNENQSEKIQKIIEADHRTDYEGSLLFEEIKHFQFFETFNERNVNNYFEKNAFIHICKKARYEKHPPGKVVFRQQDSSNGKLYIIFSGEVSIVVHGSDFFVGPPPEEELEIPVKTVHVEESSINISDASPNANSKEKVESTPTSTGTPKEGAKSPEIQEAAKTFSRIVKSKFAGITALKHKSRKASPPDRSTPTPGGSPVMSAEKTPQIREPSRESHLSTLSGPFSLAHERSSIRASFRSPNRKMTRLSTDEAAEEKSQEKEKAKTITPQSKLRAVTKLTLTTIRLGKIVGGYTKDPSEIMAFKKEAFDLVVKRYGKVQNKLERGGFFGEKALFDNTPRSATVICNTECQFLVISKRDFNFIQKNFDCKRKQVIKFMIDFIPDIENITAHEAVERLMYLLQEKTYERGNCIINEGDHGDKLYLLFEGSCEIIKNIKLEESGGPIDNQADLQRLLRNGQGQVQQIPVCNIQKGVFLGEEILYDSRTSYNFSVRVSSAFAKIFAINKDHFCHKFPIAAQNEVQRVYSSKVTNYAGIIKDLLETRFSDMTLTRSFNTTKELDLFLVYGRLALRTKTFADVRRSQTTQMPLDSNRSTEMRQKKKEITIDQESAILHKSIDLGQYNKTEKNVNVMQVKKNLYPFMRSIVSPSQCTYVQKNRLNVGPKTSKNEDTGKDDSIDQNKSLKVTCKPSPKHGEVDVFHQTAYISSMMDTGLNKSIEISPEQRRNLGLRIDLRDEFQESLAQAPTVQKRNATERAKRRSMDETIINNNNVSLDINTEEFLEQDKRALKVLQIKRKKIMMKKEPLPSVPSNDNNGRLELLFKRAQRQIKRSVFIDQSITRTGHFKIPEMEHFQLSSETLNVELSSPPKQEKLNLTDIERMMRTDMGSVDTKNSSPRTRKNRKNHSFQLQGEEWFTMTRFMTTNGSSKNASVAAPATALNEPPQETYIAYPQQSLRDKKEETHGSRLKKKHKILLQLKTKRLRDSLQVQSNSMCVPATNKSQTTKNGPPSFRI